MKSFVFWSRSSQSSALCLICCSIDKLHCIPSRCGRKVDLIFLVVPAWQEYIHNIQDAYSTLKLQQLILHFCLQHVFLVLVHHFLAGERDTMQTEVHPSPAPQNFREKQEVGKRTSDSARIRSTSASALAVRRRSTSGLFLIWRPQDVEVRKSSWLCKICFNEFHPDSSAGLVFQALRGALWQSPIRDWNLTLLTCYLNDMTVLPLLCA